jgi:RNA polymerase sigma factor (sigma-70 family)
VRNQTTLDQDIALLQGLSENDGASLEFIYIEYYPMVEHMILRNNGSYDDAKDVFQEAVLVLYQKAQDPDFTLTARLKTFIYAISRRIWLKKWEFDNKTIAIPATHEVADLQDSIDDAIAKDDQFKQLEASLAHIGEPCKTILEDYYINRKNMQQIADKFGYTNAENAKNQKYKCLQRLKKIFFEEQLKTVGTS